MSMRSLPVTPTLVATDNLPPTLSVEQAAELVGIGRNAAYRAAATGDLPAIRIGRRLRVPTARLLQMLGLRGTETREVL